MRIIKLGGREYPIRASVQMLMDSAQRINSVLQAAEDEATEDADQRELNADARAAQIAETRKAAYRNYLRDSRNSLDTIAALINGAVAAERVLHGCDIRDQVPEYPMTGEKVAFLATLAELNDPENAKAIAEEMAAANGSPKNVTAGNMTELMKKIL